MMGTPSGGMRHTILEWLKDPSAHFPAGRRRAPADTGVTARAVAAKLGVPRRTALAHLDFLTRLGLLRTRRIRCRTYYRRDEIRIAEVARMFEKGW
ncbi:MULTISPECIES: helix-turn-helix domain-containing protein [Streptomyces]|uniref:Helix-turn-helix domain-containing protein n=2 Tax=Streptomyces TaxID=1883 RepID=A0ABS9JCU0_9ACTN|nr:MULTISPECIES: helix-turn-helix domain-containing protein [Streptomyces]MYU27507.1 helix-turn-helix domain-containing protein [Streptomyces sp. SID7810]CUW26362.1 Helix-turn-helix domain protein [Streptomyces reticuli]AKN73232.1 transcriptional regulator, ArsR family protein [Streptomyces sp. PBH53]MCG0063388.1 helix-turn-helix domain-containing protein [Streptomyces tricolor]OYP19462.1 ArsR family transcriptional regulator [Streptomyces sp. FBKL.4005]